MAWVRRAGERQDLKRVAGPFRTGAQMAEPAARWLLDWTPVSQMKWLLPQNETAVGHWFVPPVP